MKTFLKIMKYVTILPALSEAVINFIKKLKEELRK